MNSNQKGSPEMDEARVREICREEITKANLMLAQDATLGIGEMASAMELMLMKAGLGDQGAALAEVVQYMRDQERDIRSNLGLEIPDDISQLGDGDPDSEPTRDGA